VGEVGREEKIGLSPVRRCRSSLEARRHGEDEEEEEEGIALAAEPASRASCSALRARD